MKKILLTDDEPMMLKLAARALKDEYDTITAASGAEALELFESERPDMMISDIKMPGMSGFELCKAIKEKYGSSVPFIFMTADESEEGESRGMDIGASAFIRKPVRADVLRDAVKAAFEGGSANAAASAPAAVTSRESKPDLKAEKVKLPEWLLHEPLIDIDAGLLNSESADAYLSSMDIFMDHVDDNVAELVRCMEAGDFEKYTIKVHGLKSTSRVIGAMVLSTTAAALERAGGDKNLDFIRQEHAAFIALYKKYQTIIASHANEGEKEDISPDELSDVMMALKEYALVEDYTLVEEILESLSSYRLDEKHAGLMIKIKTLLNRLDWDGINAILGEV